MGNGWIKLHRQLLENPLSKKPAWIWLWIVLLLKANHQENRMIWNGKTIVIREGQLITGRDALSKETGVHRSSIERILDYLENEHQIEQQKTTKYRLITIINWNEYQDKDNKTSNKRATNEQQASTNKNDKKVKNDKKETAQSAEVSAVINLFKEVNPSYQRLFGMPPQRAAADRLLKTHGIEKLSSMIAYLEKSNATKYAPTITTPSQFEAKLGELIAWATKERQGKGKGIISSV